jgi:hypothetical protein
MFGHKFKSGVYKRSTRWTKDVLEDGKKVMRSLGLGMQEKDLYRTKELNTTE